LTTATRRVGLLNGDFLYVLTVCFICYSLDLKKFTLINKTDRIALRRGFISSILNPTLIPVISSSVASWRP
jgi:hypothetical protein